MMTEQKTAPQCGPKATATISNESSPFLVEFFMVQGMGFRCMAYCGGDGKWRSAFRNEELRGKIYILE
jgi:hypothetical protein